MNKTAEEILRLILKAFELGKQGLSEDFSELHAAEYTRFSDLPPYRLQDRDEGVQLKLSLLTQLVDFEYQVENFRVFLSEDIAVAVFNLRYQGMAVNDYAFEGKFVKGVSRCTAVLKKTENGWRILHEHYSRVPEGFSFD